MAWAAMKEVRRRRRLKKRREVDKMEAAERARLQEERLQVERAVVKARELVGERFGTFFGYFELRQYAYVIQSEAQKHYGWYFLFAVGIFFRSNETHRI